MFEKKEQIKKEEKPELTRKNRLSLLRLGKERFMKEDFYGARVFLEKSGYTSKEDIEALFELEEETKKKAKKEEWAKLTPAEQKMFQKKPSEKIKDYYEVLLKDRHKIHSFSDDFKELLKKAIEKKE